MDYKTYDFAVVGGDLRQVYLAQILANRGFKVCQYALCRQTAKNLVTPAHTLQEAVLYSGTVIAPIPMTKDGRNLNHNSQAQETALPLLSDYLTAGQTFYAGCIPKHFRENAAARGVKVHDLMEDESLAVYNSIATAEGAVAEALQKSHQNLHKSHCLILGYGKCGKTLTALLKGMSCRTTVYARNPRARAEASIAADNTLDDSGLYNSPGDFDFIFNTVPALILNRKYMENMKKEAVIIDIASAPGGVDYPSALELGISAYLCPGLPGRYSPKSSAKAIAGVVAKGPSAEIRVPVSAVSGAKNI